MEEKDIFTKDSETLQKLIELLEHKTKASWSILLLNEEKHGENSREAERVRVKWCTLSRMLGAAKDPQQLDALLEIWRNNND